MQEPNYVADVARSHIAAHISRVDELAKDTTSSLAERALKIGGILAQARESLSYAPTHDELTEWRHSIDRCAMRTEYALQGEWLRQQGEISDLRCKLACARKCLTDGSIPCEHCERQPAKNERLCVYCDSMRRSGFAPWNGEVQPNACVICLHTTHGLDDACSFPGCGCLGSR